MMWFMCRKRATSLAEQNAEADPYPLRGGDAYLAVAQGRLEHQMSTIDALDGKATGILTAALAEAGFLVALLAIRTPAEHTPSIASWSGLAISACLVLAVAYLTLRASAVRDWKHYPSPKSAWNVSRLRVNWELARSLELAYDDNLKEQQRKANRVHAASRVLAVLTVVTSGTALVLVFT
jgi:hypothetical protein